MAGIIKTDVIGADARIKNIKFATDLENGRVVVRGALDTDRLFSCSTPATATLATADYLIHASVTVDPDEPNLASEFTLTAGKPGRGIVPEVGMEFTWSADALAGTPVVGEFLIPANATTQLTAAADDSAAKLSLQVLSITEHLNQVNTGVKAIVVKA